MEKEVKEVVKEEQPKEEKISFEQFKEKMYAEMKDNIRNHLEEFKISVLGEIIKGLNKSEEPKKEEKKEPTINDLLF